MPTEYESKILAFHRHIINGWKKCHVVLDQIGNMGEVPLTFDVLLKKTVDNEGSSIVAIKTSGYEKIHYTMILSWADGTKLLPIIILKPIPNDKILQGIILHIQEKGWTDENGTLNKAMVRENVG